MNVPAPAGWKSHFGAHTTLFEAPGAAGTIRCHARLPLESLARVLARVLEDRSSAWVVEATSSLITSEGEYGALSRVVSRVGPGRELHFVGCVFGDDFAVVLDARVARADAEPMMESVARELVMKISLGLGTRRRRFLYTPPAGWFAVPNGLTTSWYPPGFPDDHAQIVVYPAEPTEADPGTEIAQLVAAERDRGVRVEGMRDTPLETSGGVSGRSWSLVLRGPAPGAVVHREIVSFARAPYRYALKLECRGDRASERHGPTFLAVATSVSMLPMAGQQRINAPATRAATSAMLHWAD